MTDPSAPVLTPITPSTAGLVRPQPPHSPVRRLAHGLLLSALCLLLSTVFAPQAQAQTACTADSTAVSAYSGAGIVADCNTLLGLKDELRGTTALNWSADTAMASWHGVTVSGNRVTQLNSNGKDFSGSIPSELGQLTSLTKLALYYPGSDRLGSLERFDPNRVGPVDEPSDA